MTSGIRISPEKVQDAYVVLLFNRLLALIGEGDDPPGVEGESTDRWEPTEDAVVTFAAVYSV